MQLSNLLKDIEGIIVSIKCVSKMKQKSNILQSFPVVTFACFQFMAQHLGLEFVCSVLGD